MWLSKGHGTKKGGEGNGLVAVAVDKDKGSRNALKWTGKSSLQRPKSYSNPSIETVVLGTPSRSGFMRKFKADVPSTVSRGAPDFCTVYGVSKGKVSTMRNASRPAPFASPLLDQIQNQQNQNSPRVDSSEALYKHVWSIKERTMPVKPRISVGETFRSPFGRGGQGHSVKSFADLMSETDISFVSSSRPSTDRMSSVTYDFMDSGATPRFSTSSDTSFASIHSGPNFFSPNYHQGFSSISQHSGRTSFTGSTHSLDDMESEMRRLKLELKQTMDLYNAACREALTAKRKATELNCWRIEEERRLEESRFSEEAALSITEQEKARCREAIEAAEGAKTRAAIEAQRRLDIEKALKEAAKTKRAKDNLSYHGIRYRRYSIEEIEVATQYFSESKKIGEGAQGRSQFQRGEKQGKLVNNGIENAFPKCFLSKSYGDSFLREENEHYGIENLVCTLQVEVLSLIRHPNMVLLLGACPEYGILVYEYMAKGSLEDCLFKRGNTPALSWQIRFRIAAEIATGLLFLHQTKPEPLVHRDLKPGNILLDNNYTSKISDVGLARFVPTTSENVTQYHMTSAAGTFCYIDPEYQQTGMLGVKSDVYSLGILLLQVITAKPPMGLTHIVEQAIENETLKEVLDSDVPDWPIEETLMFCKACIPMCRTETERQARSWHRSLARAQQTERLC
ncbi:hypothetical protein POTOM_047446 [Populus tomentosa]|uniref:Protein kinase domain-containing protein n=1 Tax=Populus tomentosa TaxID=118781 RepID=A0A8X8CAV0_POPTO|nr:hypothetical protein POTOM_047446 [Populus tomentosa]